MTIAIAYAIREEHESGFWIAADARLTLSTSKIDTFVKTIDLVEGTGMIFAGTNLIPPPTAEIIRTLIASHNRGKNQIRISFYDTCRLFAYFARQIYTESEIKSKSETVLCGFYQDGSPGLAHVRLNGDEHEVDFYRPSKGGRCCVVIGDISVKPLVELAIERARESPQDGFGRMISLLYTIIKHEGDPYQGVGGGIAFGYCDRSDKLVQYPLLKIDNTIFYRGLEFNELIKPNWSSPIIVNFDQEFVVEIEQQLEELKRNSVPCSQHDLYRVSWQISGAAFEPKNLFETCDDPPFFRDD